MAVSLFTLEHISNQETYQYTTAPLTQDNYAVEVCEREQKGTHKRKFRPPSPRLSKSAEYYIIVIEGMSNQDTLVTFRITAANSYTDLTLRISRYYEEEAKFYHVADCLEDGSVR